MKNKLKKIFVFAFIMLSICTILKVSADSGWDSSYDSGGWSSSDSSGWSSSNESSSSGSGGNWIIYNRENALILIYPLSFAIITLIVGLITRKFLSKKTVSNVLLITSVVLFCIIAPPLIVIVVPFSILYSKSKKREKELFSDISNEDLNKYVDIDINNLKRDFYNKFVTVQNAWMNFDYDTLRKLCSDEIYNTYYEELEALKLKNEQNVMSDFNIISDRIDDVKEENSIVIISYYLDVEFYDYIVNTENNKVVKGNKYNKVHNEYILKFTMSKNNVPDRCPNCNAKLESGENSICPYCNSTIVKSTNDFVMVSKRRIN